MQYDPGLDFHTVVVLQKGYKKTDTLICPQCETENAAYATRCIVCGNEQFAPANRDSKSLSVKKNTPASVVTTENSPSTFPKNIPAFFQDKVRLSAFLLLLLLLLILPLTFCSSSKEHELNDGSCVQVSNRFGRVSGVNYRTDSSTERAEALYYSESGKNLDYAVFYDGDLPSMLLYFDDGNQFSGKRVLSYSDHGSLASSSFYDKDGFLTVTEEYYLLAEHHDSVDSLSSSDLDLSIPAPGINSILADDFSVFSKSRTWQYFNDGMLLSTVQEFDTQGRCVRILYYESADSMTSTVNRITEYYYDDTGKTTYYCNSSGVRSLSTDPDGTEWTYHYNENSDFLYRTKVIREADWSYSDKRISLAGYNLNYMLLDEPISDCTQFFYSFEAVSVSKGNIEGNFSIHIRNQNGKWTKVHTFLYAKDNDTLPEVSGIVELDSPTTIYGFAFLPSTEKTLSWSSYEQCSNFHVADYTY